MPDYLLTYDLDTKADKEINAEFRKVAMDHGFTCLWEDPIGQLYQLPETTLWGEFASSEAAKRAMYDALIATAVQSNTQHAIATRAFFTHISDELLQPHGSAIPFDSALVGPTTVKTCINHQKEHFA